LIDSFNLNLHRFVPLKSTLNAEGTEVSRFVNTVANNIRQYSYLEVGVHRGKTIEAIRANNRVAVDPKPLYLRRPSQGISTFKCTSDFYFENLQDGLFDFIYLDGLHHFRQTWKDLENATRAISEFGVILIDDVIPVDRFSAVIPQRSALTLRKKAGGKSGAWHGDVFKVLLMFSKLPDNFCFGTILFKQNPRAFLFARDGNWCTFPNFSLEEISEIDKVRVESVFGFNPERLIPREFNLFTPTEAQLLLSSHINAVS